MRITMSAASCLLYCMVRDEDHGWMSCDMTMVTDGSGPSAYSLAANGSVKRHSEVTIRPQFHEWTDDELEDGVRRMFREAATNNRLAVRPDDARSFFNMRDLVAGAMVVVGRDEAIAVSDPEYLGILAEAPGGRRTAILNGVRSCVRIDHDAAPLQRNMVWPQRQGAAGDKARRREARKAEGRARALLYRHLSREQKRTLEKLGWFEVTGSDGRGYRILDHYGGNVYEIEDGVETVRHCVVPDRAHPVPRPDLLLAQKVLLEADAAGFLEMSIKRAVDELERESAQRVEAFRAALEEAMRNYEAARFERPPRGLNDDMAVVAQPARE